MQKMMIFSVMEKGRNKMFMDKDIQQHFDNLKDLNKRRLEMERQMINYIAFLEDENARLKTEVKELTEAFKELNKQ